MAINQVNHTTTYQCVLRLNQMCYFKNSHCMVLSTTYDSSGNFFIKKEPLKRKKFNSQEVVVLIFVKHYTPL